VDARHVPNGTPRQPGELVPVPTARFLDQDSASVGSFPILRTPAASYLTLGDADYTVCMWVRVAAADRKTAFLWYGVTTTNGSQESLSTNSSGKIVIETYKGWVGGGEISTSVLGDNVWTHVAIRRSSPTVLEMLINGVVEGTETTDVSGRSATMTLENFGNTNKYDTRGLQGDLSQLVTFKRALSNGEIIRQSQQVAPLPGAWASWPLFDSLGSSYLDGLVGSPLTTHSTTTTSTDGPGIAYAPQQPIIVEDESPGADGAGTVYTDYIGSGTLDTSADYATMSTWFAASGTGNVTYVNGDEVRAIFQTSADGHFGPHAWGGYQLVGGICWTEDKDITITCSSTNPTGSGTPDGYLTGGASRFTFQNASSTKTWNFKGLDFIYSSSDNFRFNINTTVTSGATSPRTPVNFDRCKFLSPDSGYFFQLGNDKVFSGIIECNFTNCLILPNSQFFRFKDNNNPNAAIANLVGCTLQSSSNGGWFSNSNSPSCSFEVHMSGCVVDIGIEPEDLNGWNGVVQYSRGGYTSGTATDYITNELQSIVDGWANTQTNVSAAVSSVYGVAPAAGQVAFAGVTKAAGNPFDAFTRDLRLWDSTNNVAIKHVSNVTLPSPDLAGQDRGLSPFNAGAFEGLYVVPSSEVVLNLLTTQVNLY
jgi:hypothetical protein